MSVASAGKVAEASAKATAARSRLGIPAVPAFGPGLLSAAHVPGESIATDEIRAAVAIYARTAAAYLG